MKSEKTLETGTPRHRVVAKEGGRRLVKQSDAGNSDINEIMRKWHATGLMPVVPGRTPKYGDFSTGQDFTQAMNAVREAEEAFEQLPAAVRRICRNDPAVFLSMCSDPKAVGFLKEHGLVEERIPPVVRVLDERWKEESASSPPDTSGEGTPHSPKRQGAAKAP